MVRRRAGICPRASLVILSKNHTLVLDFRFMNINIKIINLDSSEILYESNSKAATSAGFKKRFDVVREVFARFAVNSNTDSLRLQFDIVPSFSEPLLFDAKDFQMCTNGKWVINKYNGQKIYASCGHCEACLQAKANRKTRLIKQHSVLNADLVCLFITLTYHNSFIPYVCISDLHKYPLEISVYRDAQRRLAKPNLDNLR